jgi:hypothetical protein
MHIKFMHVNGLWKFQQIEGILERMKSNHNIP